MCIGSLSHIKSSFKCFLRPRCLTTGVGQQHWHEFFFSTVKLSIRRYQAACLTTLCITVSQPLGSHQDKRRSAEKSFTIPFLSLKNFFSLGYASRKLSDQKERQEDCFWLPSNTQNPVTRTVDKINYFLPWSGKAETSEVSWPVMAAAPGLTLPSPCCIQSSKATEQLPQLVTSCLCTFQRWQRDYISAAGRALCPNLRTHPKQCVFPVSHPSWCFTAPLRNGLLYCNNKGCHLWHLKRGYKTTHRKNEVLKEGRKGCTLSWSQGSPRATEHLCLWDTIPSTLPCCGHVLGVLKTDN